MLDEGTASDGPWTLVVTEQACIEHVRPDAQGGMCGLADPARFQESSSFRTEADASPPVDVTPVFVDGRLFFSVRTPADARITGIVAVDESGEVLARLGELPPPAP